MTSYSLRRSKRARRPRVTLQEDGAVVVVLPQRAPESIADELVRRHSRWIETHQRRIQGERRVLDARPALGEGRTVPFRGVPHDVFIERLAAGHRGGIALESHSASAIVIRRTPGDVRSIAGVLDRWFRREARRDLEEMVVVRAAAMKLSPGRVTVRDQRTRWGSASRRGTLSFSWRLVLCPPEILDYVVVHELAHLRYAGHGTRFWQLVRRFAPSADHYRRWLRLNEARIRHAID